MTILSEYRILQRFAATRKGREYLENIAAKAGQYAETGKLRRLLFRCFAVDPVDLTFVVAKGSEALLSVKQRVARRRKDDIATESFTYIARRTVTGLVLSDPHWSYPLAYIINRDQLCAKNREVIRMIERQLLRSRIAMPIQALLEKPL